MKIIKTLKMPFISLCSTILFLFISSTATAESTLKAGAGFIILNTNSNLSVTSDNKKINHLNSSNKSFSDIKPILELVYTKPLSPQTKLYTGIPVDQNGLSFKLGIKHSKSRKEVIDTAIFINPIKKVWQNPFEIGVNREESSTINTGVELKYRNIKGSHVSAEYKLSYTVIDKDIIGELDSDLKRSGINHHLQLGYSIPLIPKFLFIVPEIKTEYGQIEGKSNAYHKNGAGLKLMMFHRKWTFISGLSAHNSQYLKSHSVFDKTRHETDYNWFNMFKYSEPFQVKKTYITIIGMLAKTDANIPFFDKQSSIIGLLAGYKF